MQEFEYEPDDISETNFQNLNENLQSLEFKLVCEIGSANLTINELLNLAEGKEISFNQDLQKIKLKINDKTIGFGQLVMVDGKTTIQITKLLLNTEF